MAGIPAMWYDSNVSLSTIHKGETNMNPFDVEQVSAEASTLTLEQADLTQLAQLFTWHGEAEVRAFLAMHPFLVPLLVAAAAQLHTSFPSPDLWLEVSADPDNGYTQLLLSVVIALSVAEADQRLQHFDEVWWLDQMEQAQGTLCILLRFL